MTQSLPVGEFSWDDNLEKYTENYILQLEDEADYGCFIECSLQYPQHLHIQHNTFPLCPENLVVTQDMLSSYQRKLAEVSRIIFYFYL